MSLIQPAHLLDQAETLIASRGAGALRQTDIRRALSAAYYALFHAILTAAADEAVGRSLQGGPLWALAYRSVTHRWLKEVCDEIAKPTPPKRLARFVPDGGFGNHVETIARAISDLQDKRHAADYDPAKTFLRLDAEAAIKTARSAIQRLSKLRGDRRKAFLYLVLFQPKLA